MTKDAPAPEAEASEETAIVAAVGGIDLPTTTDGLVSLLHKTRTNRDPLPFRASWLAPPVRAALYRIGGVPEIVNPAEVMLLAGRPYVSSAGAVQAALDLRVVREFYSRLVKAIPCQEAGCKGVKPNEAASSTLVFEAEAVTSDGRRFQREGYICRHTCHPDRVAETGQTRVRRKLALELLGLEPDELDEDVIDVVAIEPEPDEPGETESPPEDPGDPPTPEPEPEPEVEAPAGEELERKVREAAGRAKDAKAKASTRPGVQGGLPVA